MFAERDDLVVGVVATDNSSESDDRNQGFVAGFGQGANQFTITCSGRCSFCC